MTLMIQTPHLRNVLIIHDNPIRADLVEEGLPSEMVAHKICQIQGINLLELLDRLEPVIIIFTCNSPSLSTFENLHQVSQTNPKPILMFVEETDGDLMQKARTSPALGSSQTSRQSPEALVPS